MRAVSGEKYWPVAEARHAATLERVDGCPVQFVGWHFAGLAGEHSVYAITDACGIKLCFSVDVPSQLEINPPDAIRLLVQEGRLGLGEGWFKPEPALGGKRCLHLHVSDKEVVFEDTPIEG